MNEWMKKWRNECMNEWNNVDGEPSIDAWKIVATTVDRKYTL